MYEWERGLCSHVGKSMLKWIYSVKPSPSFCLSWSYFLRWHQQCEVLSFSVLCNPPADSFSFIQPAHWWIHCRNISSVSCRPTSPHLLTAWRPVRTTASQRYWHSVCQLLINKFNLIRRAVLVTWSPAWSIFKTVASVPSRISIQATCSWPRTWKPSRQRSPPTRRRRRNSFVRLPKPGCFPRWGWRTLGLLDSQGRRCSWPRCCQLLMWHPWRGSSSSSDHLCKFSLEIYFESICCSQ